MYQIDYSTILVLGRQPELGLAELESLYGAETVGSVASQVAGLTLKDDEIDFARLGSSTKLGRVLSIIPGTHWNLIEKELARLVRTGILLTPPSGKFHLGLSAIGLNVTPGRLTAAGLTLKKILRSKGCSVRLVPNNEMELSTAQVYHNHLSDEHGSEIILVATRDGRTIISRTVAVQDIDSYTLRDRGRPKRDARVGMLPPKLAQTIINLAVGRITDKRETPTVLDPFCGTGVLLQEALLMDYAAYGTDLEPRMIDYSRANLEWLISKLDLSHANFTLQQGDATSHKWHPSPTVVAGETYLGRPFTETPSGELLEQTVSEVNVILKKFLTNVHDQLTPGARLCLAIPAWQLKKDTFRHLPLLDSLDKLGYNRVSFEHVLDRQLLYYREDQIVARELLVITRK